MNLELLTRDTIILARQAGAFLLAERDRIGEGDIGIKGQGDLVSTADHTSEAMLRDGLTALIPGSVFMGEEESPEATGGEWRWVVDPLDGTSNYLQGLPVYAVSIALEDHRGLNEEWGPIVIGVVHEPVLDTVYDAYAGGGARRNGKPIRVRSRRELDRCVLATGFPFRNHAEMEPYFNVFKEILPKVANIRRIGSAAADLAWVADGTFDGFWEIGNCPWDIAAGKLLIEEAGGRITDFWGDDPLYTGWTLAGNRVAYEALLEPLQREFPNPPNKR